MTLGEIVQSKAHEAAALVAMLGEQDGRCAACDQAPRTFYRDADRDNVLCDSCHIVGTVADELAGRP